MLTIFVLGAYRTFDPGNRDLLLLQGLRDALCSEGWDAFLAIDDRATELLRGTDPHPLPKTRQLAAHADACFFVLTRTGRLAGVVAGLTALQLERPRDAGRRVVFVEDGYPMSAILDADQAGVLSTPPIVTVPFETTVELRAAASNYAAILHRYGPLR